MNRAQSEAWARLLEVWLNMGGATAEHQALVELVTAAEGRAPRQFVQLLAVALTTWSGDREVRDRARVYESNSEYELFTLLDLVGETEPLPLSSGWLRFVSYHRIARPASELKGPSWLQDPALAGAWIAMPGRGRYTPQETGEALLAHDARVVAIGAIASSVRVGGDHSEAVTCLCEYMVGARAASWTRHAGESCQPMRLSLTDPEVGSWWRSYLSQSTPDRAARACRTDLSDWRHVPTALEIEAQQALEAEQARQDRARALYVERANRPGARKNVVA